MDPGIGVIPKPVIERLRELAHAITPDGQSLNPYDVHGEIIPLERPWFGFPRTRLAKALDRSVHDPVAHKDLLQRVFLDQDEVYMWCFRMELDLPTFWFSEEDVRFYEDGRRPQGKSVVTAKTLRLRPDQQDKVKCQEIARDLWKAHPSMTIADMSKRREIQIDGQWEGLPGQEHSP